MGKAILIIQSMRAQNIFLHSQLSLVKKLSLSIQAKPKICLLYIKKASI